MFYIALAKYQIFLFVISILISIIFVIISNTKKILLTIILSLVVIMTIYYLKMIFRREKPYFASID